MLPMELLQKTSSGVVQIFLEKNREKLGNGSGFLVDGGIITNSHVVRRSGFDALAIRFSNWDPDDDSKYIRVLLDDVLATESPENDKDYAFLSTSEPEFQDRHVFQLAKDEEPKIGQQILFQGYPFGMFNLTSHVGFISSIHYDHGGVRLLQIDGSVNGGNSGGPLLSLETGKVIGIITRAATGLIEQQFNNLLQTLQHNQQVLAASSQSGAHVSLAGVDPIQALLASQVAMERIAQNLKRSANVGIGYAFSIDYVRNALANINQ